MPRPTDNGFNPYRWYLKDKKKFESLQENENNMVASSWLFHQQMDGENSPDGVSVAGVGQQAPNAEQHDNHHRVAVTLKLEFTSKDYADVFQGNETAHRESDTTWHTVVYVTDPKLFGECVAWKY